MFAARLTAVLAVLVLIVAIAWRMLSDPVLLDLGDPRGDATAPELLAARVDPIGDFDHEFNINHENPFVPYRERSDEKSAITAPKKPAVPKSLPTPAVPPAPMPDTPKPALPKRNVATTPGAPECLGVIRHRLSGEAVLIARIPGQAVRQLAPGDDLDGWQLTAIGQGLATFRTPSGTNEDLPVGASLPVNAVPAAAPQGNPPAEPPADPLQAPAQPLTVPAVAPPKPMPPSAGGMSPRPQNAQAPAQVPRMAK